MGREGGSKMKGRGWKGEMKEGEGEEKVSRRQPRTADPWGASSPTSIMEEV